MEGPVVLDTSVILKWFRQEEVLASQALAPRDAYLDGRIVVTVLSLVAYELANVLCYRADLATDQVQTAVRSLFDMGFEWVLLSSAMTRRAVGIARAYQATVYDAAFAALAEWLNATFTTADERLARRLEPLPFVCFLSSVDTE